MALLVMFMRAQTHYMSATEFLFSLCPLCVNLILLSPCLSYVEKWTHYYHTLRPFFYDRCTSHLISTFQQHSAKGQITKSTATFHILLQWIFVEVHGGRRTRWFEGQTEGLFSRSPSKLNWLAYSPHKEFLTAVNKKIRKKLGNRWRTIGAYCIHALSLFENDNRNGPRLFCLPPFPRLHFD